MMPRWKMEGIVLEILIIFCAKVLRMVRRSFTLRFKMLLMWLPGLWVRREMVLISHPKREGNWKSLTVIRERCFSLMLGMLIIKSLSL